MFDTPYQIVFDVHYMVNCQLQWCSGQRFESQRQHTFTHYNPALEHTNLLLGGKMKCYQP